MQGHNTTTVKVMSPAGAKQWCIDNCGRSPDQPVCVSQHIHHSILSTLFCQQLRISARLISSGAFAEVPGGSKFGSNSSSTRWFVTGHDRAARKQKKSVDDLVIQGLARFEAIEVALIEPELAVISKSGGSAAGGCAFGSVYGSHHRCGHL